MEVILKKNRKSELGSAGIVVLLAVSVFGLLASNTVDRAALEKGKVKINKEVVKNAQPVDYTKMND